MLEVGCGGSRWLAFLDEQLNCEIWGVDYSPPGVAGARASLRPSAAERILYGDFFDRSSSRKCLRVTAVPPVKCSMRPPL
ncbi:MAG: class I SAM-dependent methyltransferase [Gemmataceae bacterium]